mmetsp:Transcript_4290/g.5728  ORF Transcript_4290/g.5728 Transcript_4290/m.5728 type:complete len:300 (+) Transcript_4290:141-1040(+)|eukprot:CAMPEP_0196587036 /NCGR_PEP_ID=MMETSP1081-20130531/56221_1 /TAXON_ID=36882 /ORGANISM="Pyramimonas amylifera, Strain CCMP720" /LENGTH=299 /DNA_ID=CAMNT_0041909101 /DNA_START=138 /DNA_END=1037 /DNA_ORIENTATION=-
MVIDYSKWQSLSEYNSDEDNEDIVKSPTSIPAGDVYDPANPPALNVETGEHALKLAVQGGDKRMAALISRLVCKENLNEGNVGRARELIDSAVDLAQELQDSELSMECDALLGQVAQMEGNFSEAELHFTSAAEFYKSNRDEASEAAQYFNLGHCAKAQEEMEKARSHFEAAVNICERLQPLNQELHEAALAEILELRSTKQASSGAPPPFSFLQRAQAAGWGGEGEQECNAHSGKQRDPVQEIESEDETELEEAEREAEEMVRSLRLQGRETEAAHLESLMIANVSSDGGSEVNDDVD